MSDSLWRNGLQHTSSISQSLLKFSFINNPFNEYSGLISSNNDWFDLLVVQGALKSLLQHHNVKVSMLSLLYGPTLASVLDYWRNCSFDYTDLCWQSIMSLLFNMLFRFVIAFLPKSKCLLISWLQSLPAVILEPKKIKSVRASAFPPATNICHEVMGLDAMILF